MNAQQIAAQGRYGDNTLVHASANEVKGLDALSRSIYGQNLPRNPQTGLPEAFLFAPFLAPLMAGSIPALAGMGAVGTGLLAGGLGAAEAAARGMDDPLQQGIMAGLTGGAAAGIGGALSGAGQAATTEAIKSAAVPTGEAAAQAFGQGAQLPADWLMADAQQLAQQGLGADQIRGTLQASVAPATTGQATSMLANPLQGSQFGPTGQFGSMSQMGRGAKALMQPGAFKEGGVGQTFMQQAKVPAIAGATGLMGQSALAEEQAMREAEDERKRRGEEARAKSMGYISDIAARNPYSMAGQAYYNPFQFAEGGIVNLFGGGAIPDAYLTDEQRAKRQALFSSYPFFSGALHSMPAALIPSRIPSRSPRVPITDPSQLDDYYSNQYKTGTGIYSRVPGTGAAQDMMPIDPQQRSASLRQRFIPSAQPDGLVFQDQARQQFREALQYGAGNQLAAALTGYHNLPKPARTDLSQFIKQGGPTGGSTTKSGTSGRTAFQNAIDDWDVESRSAYATGGYLDGGAVPGDGMSDSQPAMIDGQQPAALSSGEFVVPADVVSGLGNGSSDAGAQQLYAMMDRIRKARTGTTEQAPKVNPQRMMAA